MKEKPKIDVSNLVIEDNIPVQISQKGKYAELYKLINSMHAGQSVEIPYEGTHREKQCMVQTIRTNYKQPHTLISRKSTKGFRIYILAKE